MPEYDLYVLCAECGNFHDALMTVTLEKSFKVRLTRDVYENEIPTEFNDAIADCRCPTTGRVLPEQDPGEMLLVKVSRLLP